MSYIDKSVPAFPIDFYVKGGDPYPGDGMMLRDYFAAKALMEAIKP